MDKSIANLAQQMQAIFEKQNGTLVGGFISVTNPTGPSGEFFLKILLTGTGSTNNHIQGSVNGCSNDICLGSTNNGFCSNNTSCLNSTNTGTSENFGVSCAPSCAHSPKLNPRSQGPTNGDNQTF